MVKRDDKDDWRIDSNKLLATLLNGDMQCRMVFVVVMVICVIVMTIVYEI